MHSANSEPTTGRASLWTEIAIVILVTIVAAVLSAYFEVSERLFTWTRPREYLQLDEIPAVLVVLSTALVWFAWRRYREARAARAQLATLLLDNRRLGQQLLQVQESERKTLAQELHDELGQYLNAIKIDAVSLEQQASESSSSIHQAAASIVRHTDHVYAVVRDLIRKLRPVGLDDLGLKAALEYHVHDWQQRLPDLQISLSLDGDLDSIGEALSLALYRFVQEGMTNVARHARAQRVEIRVQRSPAGPQMRDEIIFDMVDDGCGTEPRARRPGLGLIGMRERAEMLGGRLEARAQPARGFRIRAQIPVGDQGSGTLR